MMAKAKSISSVPWRNRIVGYGEEDATKLLANPKNWRIHPKNQQAALEGSLDKIGWIQNCVVNRSTGFVIDGHARVALAISRNEKVPCLYVELTPQEEALAIATLDSITALARTDQDILDSLVMDLRGFELDLGDGLEDLLESLSPLGAAPVSGEDDAPPVPEAPVTQLGDLWLLGEHRVLCGDCRDFGSVHRLMGAARVNLAFTSPPYAEQREYDQSSGFRPIPPDKYVEWYRDLAANIRAILADDGSYFLNIKPSCDGLDTDLYVMDLVLAHARDWGFHFATEFCWERNGVPKSVTQRFKNQFEPVYQFSLGRWKMRPEAVRHFSENVPQAGGAGSGETSWANKQGERGATSVSGSFGAAKKRRNGTKELMSDVQGVNHAPGEYIGAGMAYPGNRLPTFAGSHDATGHVAAFPVGLPDFFIKAYTDPGDSVFDPFMGSGSTLMAAEKNNRVGYGCELSPASCDVIVQRWQKFTGKQATLDGHGATFEHVREGRLLEAQDAIKEEALTSPTGAQGAPAPEDRADTPAASAPRQPAARKRGKVAK
jgi:DNA modification methylase